MKNKFLSALMVAALSAPAIYAANDYGLPAGIQEGNILHCFNWKLSDVKAELPNIAAAGFGSVQVSPLQRNASVGSTWADAYRPYDFKFIAGGLGTAQDLKDLCQAAEGYGIKVIVDVVANHVDGWKGGGDLTKYHDPWWNSNGRLRWNGAVDYGNRYSITHNMMGGGDSYPDVNSEDAEVQARAKAYIEELKSYGVKGIRWDAAKHIALPSESCDFWKTVTSVAGMYHYGEILDNPGGGNNLMKEYTTYMSVTDNGYGDGARNNDGVPGGHAGWAASTIADTKVVYWGESHDTYANNGGASKYTSQEQIDRAYAIVACRKGATALYLSRPSATNFNDIKIGAKGSTHFTAKSVAEVNKFRNVMVGRADYFSNGGNVASVTRKDGGAVIVKKGGGGQVSVANGGGYCPAGTYTDRVSGGQFTVTATTISGNVGSSGIAVIYSDELGGGGGGDDPDPVTAMWVLGNLEGTAGWSTTPGTGAGMTQNGSTFTAKNVKFVAAAGETKCYFNLTDYVGSTWDDLKMNANRYGAATEGASVTLGTPATIVKYANNVDASGCLSWTIAPGTYDITADLSAMTLTVTNSGDTPAEPKVTFSPNGGSFSTETISVTATLSDATSGWIKVGNGAQQDFTSTKTFTIGEGMQAGDNVTVSWSATKGTVTKTGSVTFTKAGGDDDDSFTIYYDNATTNWATPHIHYWTTPSTEWPGVVLTKVDGDIWKYTFAEDPSGLTGFLFCDGKASGGDQTADQKSAPIRNHLYTGSGNKGAITDLGVYDPTPIDPNADVFIYLIGVDWTQANAYIYNDGDAVAEWPGVSMEMIEGRWTYKLPDAYKNCLVIFSSNGGSQYPGANEPGLAVCGRSMEFDYSTKSWLAGLENVTDTATAYEITSADGAITVAGAEGLNVIVAGIDGKIYRLATPASSEVHTAVAPGLYIVNVDGRSVKVLVK